MLSDEYKAFTGELQNRLENDSRVLGLIAVGSMAGQDYSPDEWSDHDFYVIVQSGEQENFRSQLEWLPDADRIVFQFRETAHGVKVLYASGHLLEFAIFDLDELHVARVNRHRILFDKQNVREHLQQVAAKTFEQTAASKPSDAYLFGQFVTNVLVASGRHARGEVLSGRHFLQSAITHLVGLLERYASAERMDLLDNLDPLRRFEKVFPSLGKELAEIAPLTTPVAGERLLRLADRELRERLSCYSKVAVETVYRRVAKERRVLRHE